MSNAPEDFEKLRKLLKLKQYEQPPPGYFNNFSERVMARLETEGRDRRVDLLSADAPWVKRMVRALETNPIFAGAFGVAICTLLVFGITSFENVDRSAVAVMSDGSNGSTPTLLSSSSSETLSTSINPRFSTNLAGGSPFNVEPVLFSPGH